MRPRIRTIKPELWADERVGNLSHGARLLFIGLITMADDEGRVRELPTAILGHIFPYDHLSIRKLDRWLVEVEATGMIVRYEVDGQRYIAFRRWGRHQKVDRPRPSELPSFSTNNRRTIDESSIPPREGASGPVLSDPDPSDDDQPSESASDRALFDYWREQCGHPDAKASSDRMAKIRARRKEGYTDEQIRQGIDGAARAAHVSDTGRRFDDIELICRTGSKLESFIGRCSQSNGASASRFAEYDRAAGL